MSLRLAQGKLEAALSARNEAQAKLQIRLNQWLEDEPQAPQVTADDLLPPEAVQVVRHTKGLLELDWRQPSGDLCPESYRIEVTVGDGMAWYLAAITRHTEAQLTNLPQDMPLRLRVISQLGQKRSLPSQLITVTL